MAENYKHLYEQTKKMLTMYQDELIPGFRKEVEELKENLAESEKVVIQLRKQWQDAEMHICTMCGHFNHKADGNVVYGNQTCGEICGYPFCKEKFTPWIPVSERLPGENGDYLVFKGSSYGGWCEVAGFAKDGSEVDEYDLGGCENVWYDYDSEHGYIAFDSVTHWMPLPTPPKEA